MSRLGSRDEARNPVALFVAFNESASRRDKWFRLVQYASRLVILSHGADLRPSWLSRLKGLEAATADARKLFRLTNAPDAALRTWRIWLNRDVDPFVRWSSVVGQGCKVLWLLHDHALFLCRAGVLSWETGPLGRRSAQCWLAAFAALILKDVRRIGLLSAQIADAASSAQARHNAEAQRRSAGKELKRNCLDLCLPLSSLGYLPPRVGATAGVLSTLNSIMEEWAKLIFGTVDGGVPVHTWHKVTAFSDGWEAHLTITSEEGYFVDVNRTNVGPNYTFCLGRNQPAFFGFNFRNASHDDFDVSYALVMRQHQSQLGFSSRACVFFVSAWGAADPDIRPLSYHGAKCDFQVQPGRGEDYFVR